MRNSGRKHIVRITLGLLAVVALFSLPREGVRAAGSDSADGVRLNLTMLEILQSDPPETTIVDTLGVSVAFGHETTLRIGNTVLYVTASRAKAAEEPPWVHLSYDLFVTGPNPEQRNDAALVEYGTPLVVDGLKGKGKSAYRILIVPHPAAAPTGTFIHNDTATKDAAPSIYFLFHANSRSRAAFHHAELSKTLDGEYMALRDSFRISEPGRIDYHVIEGPCADIPLEPRSDYAVDPSRNTVVARYDREFSGVDAEAALLLTLYRTWGYAPEFLARGAAAYFSPSDLEVIADRDSGRVVPLDSIVESYTFKRQPYPASMHHAASFVRWLITTRGFTSFREAYSRSTDLSAERALWSVYGKTLKELEIEWLAYLKKRRFNSSELYSWSMRAAGYHRYTEHYDLLLRAITSTDTIPDHILEKMGRAASQLGRWPVAVQYFLQSFKRRPNNPDAIALLAGALLANGQPNDAEFHLKRLLTIDSTSAFTYLLLGDIQKSAQRTDSAAALWRHGLTTGTPDPATVELLIRLGNYERRRVPDSSRAHLQRAVGYAGQILQMSHGDLSSLILCGEAMMAVDSVDHALSFYRLAAHAADAPQDLGQIWVGIGQCYDLKHNREEAVNAYKYVFQIPAADDDLKTAQYYINHIYKQ